MNKKKNDEIYHEYKTIAPIKNKKGSTIHFVSTGKDITELITLEKELEKLATTDKLTGISNRLKFDQQLQHEIERAKRYKINLSLIMFDVDNFKMVNDTYGHIAGDHALKMIANLADKNKRSVDILARWGGEEFIILQSDSNNDAAIILAERIRENIENYKFEKTGKITSSFGVTHFKENDDADSFIKRADEALYKAKKTGKNRVIVK